MGELENKKKLAIQDVLNAVREQMKKDGIVSNDMWFNAVASVLHFNEIKYIEKKENGDIEISYPFGKETYGNRCYITISPDGTAHIRGIQTSPEKRYEHINPRGDFDFYLKIENWVETENITEITSSGYGKEPLPNGILDNILPEVIDEEFMVRKLTSLYPNELYEMNSPELTSADLNEVAIEQAKGKKTTIPTFWGNFLDEKILCLHPEAAAIFMEQIISYVENGEIDKKVILYENKGYDSWNGNTYDIGFNIKTGELFGVNNLYIIERDGIVLQDENLLTYPNEYQGSVQSVNDTKLEEQYNRYKAAVLGCLDNEIQLNYREFVNDDLRNDPDFIQKANKILAESEKYSLGNFAEITRKEIGIIDQTQIGKDIISIVLQNSKGELKKKSVQDGYGENDYTETYYNEDGTTRLERVYRNNEYEHLEEIIEYGDNGKIITRFFYKQGEESIDYKDDEYLTDMDVEYMYLQISTLDGKDIFYTRYESDQDSYGRFGHTHQEIMQRQYYDIKTGKAVSREQFLKSIEEQYPNEEDIVEECGVSKKDLLRMVEFDLGIQEYTDRHLVTDDELYYFNRITLEYNEDESFIKICDAGDGQNYSKSIYDSNEHLITKTETLDGKTTTIVDNRQNNVHETGEIKNIPDRTEEAVKAVVDAVAKEQEQLKEAEGQSQGE